VQIVGPAGALVVPASRYSYDASSFTLKVDLTDGGPRHRTMLSDGRYSLQLDSTLITAVGSSTNHLNLQGSSPFADGQVRYGFFRLLGDLNGDGVINSQDLVLERNEIIGYAGAVATVAGDLNGDGLVDMSDYTVLRARLGKRI
jgi:hypothetical protein